MMWSPPGPAASSRGCRAFYCVRAVATARSPRSVPPPGDSWHHEPVHIKEDCAIQPMAAPDSTPPGRPPVAAAVNRSRRTTAMRWMRRLAWALLAVLGLWLLLWLALPPLARSQIEKQATQRLGRAVTVGQVSIKPWSLEFRLLDVTVAHAPAADRPAEPQFQVHRIYANLSARSLWELAPVVDALAVSYTHLRAHET